MADVSFDGRGTDLGACGTASVSGAVGRCPSGDVVEPELGRWSGGARLALGGKDVASGGGDRVLVRIEALEAPCATAASASASEARCVEPARRRRRPATL
jgi:hypothetical protein